MPADVDVFNRLVEGHAGLLDGRAEGIQVDDHHVDRLHAELLKLLHVLGVIAHGEQPRVNRRVQRLHAPVEALREAGVPNDAVRTQEIGDYWRESGREFLVSKRFDLTLTDFKQIDRIVRHVDTKGIHTMRIGELKNKDMQLYHRKGKIAALMAAREKAAYLVEALGQKLGGVERIIEEGNNGFSPVFTAQSNVSSSDAASFDGFRTIKNHYSMSVRFEILDQ